VNLHIRPLEERDYDFILSGWWSDWNWVAPKKDFLPNNGTGGLLVMEDNYPICAGFIYFTNSSVAWVDWIVSSKSYRKKPQRKQAIILLIDELTNIAKNAGCSYTYALIKHGALKETYKELGYIEADTYNSEMIKAL
jgi:hypothetical protein